MKPTAAKTTWMVWTDNQTYNSGFQAQTTWRWVAHGPLGSDAGVAETPEEAVQRAFGATMLLSAAGSST